MSLLISMDRLKEKDVEIMTKKLEFELPPSKFEARKPAPPWKPPKMCTVLQKHEDRFVSVPFYWGISYFGKDQRTLRNDCQSLSIPFQGKLREEQKLIYQESLSLLNKNGTCLMAIYPGGGKCLGKGTRVQLWDGSVKHVEDVCRGDQLRGDDDVPRNVLSITSGKEEMFVIRYQQCPWIDYRVNRSHVLTLFDTVHQCIVDVPLERLWVRKDWNRYRGIYFDRVHHLVERRRAFRHRVRAEMEWIFDKKDMEVETIMHLGLFWRPIEKTTKFIVSDPYHVLHPNNEQKRVFLLYEIDVIREQGEDDYYGFEIDQNQRFLLANGICTHNTITSLALASKVGLRTMIFVNKVVLIDQWIASIQKTFDSNIKIQVIRGASTKINPQCDFYIMNALNVGKHTFQTYRSLGIGLLIVDECHLMMTRVFSQAFSFIFPRYLLGLSATPFRLDGYDVLLELYFGLHKVVRKLYRPHDVYYLESPIVIEHEKDAKGNILWNSVIEKQTLHASRNQRIAQLCRKYPLRNILILSKRIRQIQEIYDHLIQMQEHATMMKEGENDFDVDARILIATFQKVGTGFSHDKLDMLILASDTEEYFIQYLGRVFRRPDVKPIIIDIVDRHPILKKHFATRKKVYQECGGTIQKASF